MAWETLTPEQVQGARNIKRWDVYDAADHLEDFCPALYRAFEMKDWNMVLSLAEDISDWADKLWAMSVRGGQIGPSPFYEELDRA